MPLDHDSVEYSIMSYRSYIGAGTGGLSIANGSYPQTLMMYDIAALQEMYGPNWNTNSGDTIYKWSSTTGQMSINGAGQATPLANKIFATLWDGGGRDTYDFSNYTTNLSVNLQPGAWSIVSTTQLANLGGGHNATGNIANALQYHGSNASLIEDAIGGSGNDTIVGNAADNRITGGAGNDFLDGKGGINTACYSSLFGNYTIVYNLDTSWTVTDNRATCPDGVDILYSFSWLKFSDMTVELNSSIFQTSIQPPVISALANDSNYVDGVTNNNAIALSGTAAASATINIYAGSSLIGTVTADAGGNWSFTSASLADGGYTLTATATNQSGQTSAASTQFLLTVDTVAPQNPTIASFSPDSATAGDKITNQNIIQLSGTAEANSFVHIYEGQTLIGVATAGADGSWTLSTGGAAAGAMFACSCPACMADRAEAGSAINSK